MKAFIVFIIFIVVFSSGVYAEFSDGTPDTAVDKAVNTGLESIASTQTWTDGTNTLTLSYHSVSNRWVFKQPLGSLTNTIFATPEK